MVTSPAPEGEHPWQPREWLEKEERSHQSTKNRLADEKAAHAATYALLRKQSANIQLATEQIRMLTEEITGVRIALGKVAVYEGILAYSPTVVAVDALVRDHEELEARIDAAVHLLSGLNDSVPKGEIARLLKGGIRVPDDIGEIEK